MSLVPSPFLNFGTGNYDDIAGDVTSSKMAVKMAAFLDGPLKRMRSPELNRELCNPT